MPCETNRYVGKDVTLEYVIACGDEMPLESDWKRLGAMRTKSLTFSWDTVDATADDALTAIRSNLATWMNFELSADGVAIRGDSPIAVDQRDLKKHFLNPTETGGQPIIVVRVTAPDVTYICAMLLSNYTLEYPYDDVATWSIEASITTSEIGLVVEDTPTVPETP